MAYDEGLQSITLLADSSIGVYTGPPGIAGSTSPNGGFAFRFVKLTGAKTAGLATSAANEDVIGVLQNKPQKVGDAATVGLRGVSLVVCGGTVAANDPLKVDSTGRAVTGIRGTDNIVGTALSGAAIGQLISALITPAN